MLDELARFNQARWTELVAADIEFARPMFATGHCDSPSAIEGVTTE